MVLVTRQFKHDIPTVQDLIHMRLRDPESKPGHRNDPYKLAVVAEDGGMLWVIAGGMFARLGAHGIGADIVVGTSGGGLAAAYYAAGSATDDCMVLRYLTRKGYDLQGGTRFLHPGRMFKRKPVLDVKGLIHIAFSEKVPLNWDKLRASPVQTYLTATTRKGNLVLQPLHGAPLALQKEALENTARVPLIAHDVRDPHVLWDGALVAGIPIQQAFDVGATHVLVLRCKSRQTGFTPPQVSLLERYLLWPLLQWRNPDICTLVKTRNLKQVAAINLLKEQRPTVQIVALDNIGITAGTTEEGPLFRHMVAGFRKVGEVLSLPDIPLPESWGPEAAAYL